MTSSITLYPKTKIIRKISDNQKHFEYRYYNIYYIQIVLNVYTFNYISYLSKSHSCINYQSIIYECINLFSSKIIPDYIFYFYKYNND